MLENIQQLKKWMYEFTAVKTSQCISHVSCSFMNLDRYSHGIRLCISYDFLPYHTWFHQEYIHLCNSSPCHLTARGCVSDTSFNDMLQYVGNMQKTPMMLLCHWKLRDFARTGRPYWIASSENSDKGGHEILQNTPKFVARNFRC